MVCAQHMPIAQADVSIHHGGLGRLEQFCSLLRRLQFFAAGFSGLRGLRSRHLRSRVARVADLKQACNKKNRAYEVKGRQTNQEYFGSREDS